MSRRRYNSPLQQAVLDKLAEGRRLKLVRAAVDGQTIVALGFSPTDRVSPHAIGGLVARGLLRLAGGGVELAGADPRQLSLDL